MTELQDVSVIVIDDCELAAITNGLRTLNRREHLIEIHMRRIDNIFRGGLLHGAQVQIDLD